MNLHPSIIRQASRLWGYSLACGLLAFVVYALTVSRHAYPGRPASLIAEAAGLVPAAGTAHPLFTAAARAATALPFAPAPLLAGLFCALCGAASVALFGYWVGRTILFSACEDAGGGGGLSGCIPEEDSTEESSENSELPDEVLRFNRRVGRLAGFCAVMAALLLAFSSPLWAASTRVDTGVVSLLLLLGAAVLFPVRYSWTGHVGLFFSMTALVLGLCESSALLLALPVYLCALFFWFLAAPKRAWAGATIGVAAAAGAACALAVLWLNATPADEFFSASGLLVCARGLVRHHVAELRAFLLRIGWLNRVLLTGLTAFVLLFGRQTLFRERKLSALVATLLLALPALPGLLHMPFVRSLFAAERQPVLVYAVWAAGAAVACAAAWLFIVRAGEGSRVEENEADRDEDDRPELGSWANGIAGCVLGVLLLVSLVVPWCGWKQADPRPGAFADQTARKVLETMGARRCLISDGLLDNHLLLQARQMARSLDLVTLRSHPVEHEMQRLRRQIAESPLFEGLNRRRLNNALSIGSVRFVMEWMNMATNAETCVLTLATPELWVACGYQALPEGLAFGGSRAKPDSLALGKLSAVNRDFAVESLAWFAERESESGVIAVLRGTFRMKAGFALNEWGVLLEESGQPETALEAYGMAIATDPFNVSAAVNRYTLAQSSGLSPERLDALGKDARDVIQAQPNRSLGFSAILQHYGTIRHPVFYRQQCVAWAVRGASKVASDKLKKSLALSNAAGGQTLTANAQFWLQAGDCKKAEACFRSALEENARNVEALAGLCMLMLSQGNADAAQTYLDQAEACGLSDGEWSYRAATLALLKKDTGRAMSLLLEATRKFPQDMRFWALLAGLLLDQGETQRVELNVLPAMQKALKSQDAYMVHAVRGVLLRKKGGRFLSEARASMLTALSKNVALWDIWDALLDTDVTLGNPEFIVSDARSLLEVSPDHAFANYLLGSHLLLRGRLEDAEDFLRRSVANRETAEACNNLADCLRRERRLAEAETFAKRAMALSSDWLPAQDTYANVLTDAGRYHEAAQLAEKLVSAQPDRAEYRLTCIRAQVKLGKRDALRMQLAELEERGLTLPEALQQEIRDMK